MCLDNTRFHMQDLAYNFPYHYLPDLTTDGVVHLHRSLAWGLEYLTYMSYVRDKVVALKPRSVLDVGCGDGRLLHMLDGSVPVRAGVDLSARAIAFARAFNPDAKLFDCSVADVPATFELLTCVETLEHVSDSEIADFLSGMHGKLAPRGALIICVPTVVRPVIEKHWRHYTLELCEAHLAPYFSIQEAVWLFRCGVLTNLLNRLLQNRWFVLEHRRLKRALWSFHRRWSFFASKTDGSHLVAVCRRVQDGPGTR